MVTVNLQVHVAGEAISRSETLLERAGAHTIAVTTVLPELAVSLCSAYVADLSGHAGVTHLRGTSSQQEFVQRLLDGLPGQTVARGCLLDHAAELHALLAASGQAVRVNLPDSALATAERLWDSPPSP